MQTITALAMCVIHQYWDRAGRKVRVSADYRCKTVHG
jgi:hypothetical protein